MPYHQFLTFPAIILFTGLFFLVLFRHVKTNKIIAVSAPVGSYDKSVKFINSRHSKDGPEIGDDCHDILLTHGAKTAKAVVMYHGYTNCPRQYEQLAHMFFQRGYNVFVPRIPYHGNVDLYTQDIGKLTTQDLITVCDQSIDLANGLGDEITVLGLSMGGVMAAWNAQERQDIDTAVIIVPSFAWYFLPRTISPVINLAKLFPNMYLWWDPIKREKRQAPHTMYHKFSTHGMAHILQLSLSVMRKVRTHPLSAKRAIMITNEMDVAVDEKTTRFVADQWRAHGSAVKYYQFPKMLKMEHDIIDPEHPYEKVDVVYQKIFELIEEE